MDLTKTIRELYAEKKRIEEAIASLEGLPKSKAGAEAANAGGPGLKRRRGRKSMPPEERRSVSERMRKYWAQRRSSKARNAGKAQS
jgi:hypothetical protein